MSENWPRLQRVSKEQQKRGLNSSVKKKESPAHKVLLCHTGEPGWQFPRRTWWAATETYSRVVAWDPEAVVGLSARWVLLQTLCYCVAAVQPCLDTTTTTTLKGHPGMASWAPKTWVYLVFSGSECFPLNWTHVFQMLQLGTLYKN